MRKVLLYSAVVIMFLSYSITTVAAMTLDSIGASSVGGRRISSWTYQGKNPVFKGTTDPSAQVTVTINDTSNSVTADSSGAWTYAPTQLSESGSYPITIASAADSLTFTLDLTVATGAATTETKGGTTSGELTLPEELPQTGSWEQTALLLGSGLAMTLIGVGFYWKVVPKLLLEERDSTQMTE